MKDRTFWYVLISSIAVHLLVLLFVQGMIIFKRPPKETFANTFHSFKYEEIKNSEGQIIRHGEAQYTVSTEFTVDDIAEEESGYPAWKGDPFAVAEPPIHSEDQLITAEIQAGITPRQEFFGVRIQSPNVVFVIDCSGSMLEKTGPYTRLKLAFQGMKDAVSGLNPNQKFNVILFAEKHLSFRSQPVSATFQNKAKAYSFLNNEPEIGGTTNLQDAIFTALQMKPSSIIVLSDGTANTEPDILLAQIRHLRKKFNQETAIYAIGFFLEKQSDAEKFLMSLTHQNNGIYTRWENQQLPGIRSSSKFTSLEFKE